MKTHTLCLLGLSLGVSTFACGGGGPKNTLAFDPTMLSLTCMGQNGLVVADVNGDKRPDIVTSCQGDDGVSKMHVLVNVGRQFKDTDVDMDFIPSRTGDFDGDGRMDVLGFLAGTTTQAVVFDDADGLNSPVALDIGDSPIRGTVNVIGGGTGIVLDTSDGFEVRSIARDGSTKVVDSTSLDGFEEFVGDLNADGLDDALVYTSMSYSSGTYSVAIRRKDGGFFGNQQLVGTCSYFADIDGDGYADALCTDGSSYELEQNDGTGSFRTVRTIPDEGGRSHLVDVTGNGLADLVLTVSGDDGQFAILPGRGDFTFGDALIVSGPWTSDATPTFVDLDGDGKLDFIVTDDNHVMVGYRK